MSDLYEEAYNNFRTKRMKPRRKLKVTDETKVVDDATKAAVYEEAARLFHEGDREGAVEHVRTHLGDEAAKEAEGILAEAGKAEEAKAEPAE